jgi:peptidoglycan/xylan/chitin deacetylase (PgdA/CDA1 family)
MLVAGGVALLFPGASDRASERSRVATTTTVAPTTTTTTLVGNRFANPIPAYINAGPTDRPQVAITIDDIFGVAQAQQLAQVLDLARVRNVHLTIFPTGWALSDHTAGGLQEVWRRAVLDGHEIGNHTDSHLQPTRLTDAQLRDEITRAQSALDTALGPQFKYQERLFRPPGGAGGYGGGDPRIMAVLKSMGYSMAMWSIDSNGTSGFQSYLNKIVSQARNGSIILIHFATFTPDNIATLIDRLRNERHLEPVTISELYPPS